MRGNKNHHFASLKGLENCPENVLFGDNDKQSAIHIIFWFFA